MTVSWPATEWRGESDLHYHHGGRYKRQEADLVAPAEVAETPLETGSGIHGEESGALEDGSFEGSAGYTVGSDESGGGEESSGGSADPEESSAEGGSTLEHSGHREDDASGPNFNVVTEESGDFEGNQDSSGIHPESRGDKIENGNHPGGSGDDNSEEDIAVVEKVAVEAGAVTGAVYVEAESVPTGEGSGDGTAESQAVAHFSGSKQTSARRSSMPPSIFSPSVFCVLAMQLFDPTQWNISFCLSNSCFLICSMCHE